MWRGWRLYCTTALLFNSVCAAVDLNVTQEVTSTLPLLDSTIDAANDVCFNKSCIKKRFPHCVADKNLASGYKCCKKMTCEDGKNSNFTRELTPEFFASNNETNVCLDMCPKKRYRVCMVDYERPSRYKCCKKLICDDQVTCPDPGSLENGKRVPEEEGRFWPFHPNHTIIFSCHHGYKLNSVGVISCNKSGNWYPSKPKCVLFRPGLGHNNNPSQSAPPDLVRENSLSKDKFVIVGVCCVGVLVVFIMIWFLWRKCRRNYIGYMPTRRQSSIVLENNYSPPPMQPGDLAHGSVSAENFIQYVAIRHSNNDQKFIQEFEEIQNWTGSRLTWEASLLSENKDKNRYTNIVAYDHSRVRLCPNNNRANSSDYINANYVSSYYKPKAYIACQGPLPSTYNDFWKMIWLNNTSTIVMVTNLMEKGRRKCDQYWPQEGKEQYKHISVTLKRTETFSNYTIRTFSIKNTKLSRRNARCGERRVLQFHFTQWPDHGTPEYLLPVLTFIKRSFGANPPHAGPIVIHCSAGVGRTGTYIVIHSMMQMLQATGRINIKEFLKRIRQQRNHLVQTEDQYVFVHDALLEYIVSGVTECSLLQLPAFYQSLIATNENVKISDSASSDGMDSGNAVPRTGLSKQFMKVLYSRNDTLDYDFATRPVHERKNRPGALLPVFRSRVLLSNSTSAEGSDYINASFVQGYRSSHEFIITQLPLSNTKNDFWQLIWDHNCPTIVTIKDEHWDCNSDTYWPSKDRSLHCPSFNVTFALESFSAPAGDECDVVTRDFILEATKDDYVLEVKQFELSKWNVERPTPAQLNAVASIVNFTTTKEGSTVIQDRFGGTSAVQLACWHYFQCQLNNENTVDVYQTAVVASQMRPRVFTAPAHFRFLYEAILLEANARVRSSHVIDEKSPIIEKMEKESEDEIRFSSPTTGSSSASDIPTDAIETDCLV